MRGALREPVVTEVGSTSDPVEAVRHYARAAADELFVRAGGRELPLPVLAEMAAAEPLAISMAPRSPTADAIAELLKVGASRAVVENAALEDPDLIARLARAHGSESITVFIHARAEDGRWRVLKGAGGPETEWDAVDWARVVEAQGGGEVVLEAELDSQTDTSYDVDLLGSVAGALHIPMLAGGTPEALEDLFDALMIGDADGVLVGSLFHSGQVSPRAAKDYLQEHGLAVRRVGR